MSAERWIKGTRVTPELAQYVETMLWSGTGEDEEPLDSEHGIEDLSHDALRDSAHDLRTFLAAARAARLITDDDDETVAHDFWLTRNRHGAGFWDGDYPEHGDALTELAHAWGERAPYVGDDGEVHLA